MRGCHTRPRRPRPGGRPGDVHQLHADIGKARKLLDFEARIDFETGVQRYIHWVRGRYPDASVLLEAGAINWSMPAD